MSDQLSVALIDQQLKDLVHWERFALHLEDIVYADIEIIKKEHPLVANQRLALFDKWLHKCSKPTWNKLALALEKVDENRLAQQLRKQIQLVQGSEENKAKDTGAVTPTIDVDEQITRKLVKLHETFLSIATEFKKELSNVIQAKQLELKDVKMFTKEEKGISMEEIDDVTDIDMYFRVIFPHYHFLDCHLLVMLAKQFLNPSQVLEGLNQQQKNISDLKRNVKIKQLKQVLESFVSKVPHDTPVTVKVHDAWYESELHAVEVLLQTMFRLPHSDVLKIFRVVPGSVIIVYLVPHHITESLITHTQYKTEFMRLTGIISLQVGETYVLREDEKEGEYSFDVALIEAVGMGNCEAVTFLLKYVHANANTQTHPQNHTLLSPLLIAYGSNDVHMMQILLQHNANPNTAIDDYDSSAVLYVASESNDLEIVDVLLRAKADPDIQNKAGATPLYIASQVGHLEIVERLLQAKANPDTPRDDGVTPLYIASQGGHIKVVERLLQAKANPDRATNMGVTPLFVASQEGHLQIVERLLQAKANPDRPRDDGAIPLFIASQKGHIQVVEKLLRMGKAVPDIPEYNGVTPLHIASRNGHLAVVELLLSANANPEFSTDNGVTPLYLACSNGHLEVVKKLIQWKVSVNTPAYDGTMPLHIACLQGHLEVVKVLLQANAVVDIPNNDGLTPLFIASQEGHYEIVEELLQATANPDVSNHLGETPLFIACKNGHVEVIKRLLQANADLNSPSLEGVTPLMIANRHGRTKVSEVIEHHVVSSFNDQHNSSTQI